MDHDIENARRSDALEAAIALRMAALDYVKCRAAMEKSDLRDGVDSPANREATMRCFLAGQQLEKAANHFSRTN